MRRHIAPAVTLVLKRSFSSGSLWTSENEGMRSRDTEVFLTFGIYGIFSPEEATARLGIAATRTWERGAAVGNGRSNRKRTSSAWMLETDRGLGDTIQPHLEWLLDTIEPRAGALAELRHDETTARVDCFWASIGMSGGPWITSAVMKRLAALDLDLVVSFYATDPEESD